MTEKIKQGHDITYAEYRKNRTECIRWWIIDHPGASTLCLSIIAFIINFIYYVYICGSVIRYGIFSFEKVNPSSGNLQFHLLLCFGLAAIVLLTNYLSYSRQARCSRLRKSILSILRYYLYSLGVTIIIFLIVFLIASASEISAMGFFEFIGAIFQNILQNPRKLGVYIGLSFAIFAVTFFPGIIFVLSKKFVEWQNNKSTEDKKQNKDNLEIMKKPKNSWVFYDIIIALIVFIFVVAFSFFGGFWQTISHNNYKLVNDESNSPEYLVVYEDGNQYCLEPCKLCDDKNKETLTVYIAYQKWIPIDEVLTVYRNIDTVIINDGLISDKT